MKSDVSHKYQRPQYFAIWPKKSGASSVTKFSGGRESIEANRKGSLNPRVVSRVVWIAGSNCTAARRAPPA